MRICVFTDVHANRYALDAILDAASRLSVDRIVHTGDLVGIGPHPAEVLQTVSTQRNLVCTVGNHEQYVLYGSEHPDCDRMPDSELAHNQWVNDQTAEFVSFLAGLPVSIETALGRQRVLFIHYGLTPESWVFSPILKDPTDAEMVAMFPSMPNIAFFGHVHDAVDITVGSQRCLNPGSAGCQHDDVAPFYVVESLDSGVIVIDRHLAQYDKSLLLRDYERIRPPDSEFILSAFHGVRR